MVNLTLATYVNDNAFDTVVLERIYSPRTVTSCVFTSDSFSTAEGVIIIDCTYCDTLYFSYIGG